MKTKKMYLKTLAQNMRQFGLKVAGKITKEQFSNESEVKRLINQEQKEIHAQKQRDDLLYSLVKEHGYAKGKVMFDAMEKNNSLSKNNSTEVKPKHTEVDKTKAIYRKYHAELSQKYGEETAMDMLLEMEGDPDFLNKLYASEKEDYVFEKRRKDETEAKQGQAPKKETGNVNWERINNLPHNREYELQNKARSSKETGDIDKSSMDKLEHNQQYDENNPFA